jgi:hypothetical protein
MLDRAINFGIYSLAKLIEYLNVVVFKMVEWRSPEEIEAPSRSDQLDVAEDPDTSTITLREFDLGDLMIKCPNCDEDDHVFLVGLTLYQSDEDKADHFDITTVGMIAYTCGCIVHSICLTDKVAAILDASEAHTLTIDMLTNLDRCEEHGVLHVEE